MEGGLGGGEGLIFYYGGEKVHFWVDMVGCLDVYYKKNNSVSPVIVSILQPLHKFNTCTFILIK